MNAVLTKHSIGDANSRSVFVGWMNMTEHDPEAFLNRLDRGGKHSGNSRLWHLSSGLY